MAILDNFPKEENGGSTAKGKLSAQEFNKVINHIEGLPTNVLVNGVSVNSGQPGEKTANIVISGNVTQNPDTGEVVVGGISKVTDDSGTQLSNISNLVIRGDGVIGTRTDVVNSRMIISAQSAIISKNGELARGGILTDQQAQDQAKVNYWS